MYIDWISGVLDHLARWGYCHGKIEDHLVNSILSQVRGLQCEPSSYDLDVSKNCQSWDVSSDQTIKHFADRFLATVEDSFKGFYNEAFSVNQLILQKHQKGRTIKSWTDDGRCRGFIINITLSGSGKMMIEYDRRSEDIELRPGVVTFLPTVGFKSRARCKRHSVEISKDRYVLTMRSVSV